MRQDILKWKTPWLLVVILASVFSVPSRPVVGAEAESARTDSVQPDDSKPRRIDPAKMEEMKRKTKQARKIMEQLRPLMEGLSEALGDDAQTEPPPDDGVTRVLVPTRTIKRPPLNCDLSLWAGNEYLALLPYAPVESLRIVDGALRVSNVSSPATRLRPAVGVGQGKGLILLKAGCYLPVKTGEPAVYQVEQGKAFRKLIELREQRLSARVAGPETARRTLNVSLFEWMNGYGLLCSGSSYTEGRQTQHTSWIIQYDSSFKEIGTIDIPGGFCWSAFASGPEGATAVVVQGNSFVFVKPDGTTQVAPVTPPPNSSRIGPVPFAGAMLWERPGMVPGSQCFALPRADRGTLPVFDMTTWPPSLLHTFETDYGPQSRWVTLVAGRTVFLKEDRTNIVSAWSFEGIPEQRWSRFIRGTDNRGQAYLGYHRKNVIIPGRAGIYFVNEDNGWVNYRFSVIDPPGDAVVPENAWLQEAGGTGREHDIVSYAVFKGYLLGCTRDRKQPIYVWEIPNPLIPRTR